MARACWNKYFMAMARLAAERSTCLRRKIGAVAVRDHHVLATGYNGAPTGLEHCIDSGCPRTELDVPSGQRHELCRAVHAEMNLLAQAARHGVKLKNCTIYCTASPCIMCAKVLINVGIKRFIYDEEYPDKKALIYMADSGIKLIKMEQV